VLAVRSWGIVQRERRGPHLVKLDFSIHEIRATKTAQGVLPVSPQFVDDFLPERHGKQIASRFPFPAQDDLRAGGTAPARRRFPSSRIPTLEMNRPQKPKLFRRDRSVRRGGTFRAALRRVRASFPG